MKDEKKLKNKKKIREWQENLKNYKTKNFLGAYEVPFPNMIDLIQKAYELYGYKEKLGNPEFKFTRRIINEINEMLNEEYNRLSRIDNPYKYVPEEWLDDSVTAEDIITEINAKWQKKDKYGKIEQEYWVEVGMRSDEKGIKYYVYQRYCGNTGHHNPIYGDYDDSLKDCILAFWEDINCKITAFTRDFLD